MVNKWFEDVIRRETEKCRVTMLGEDNKKYPYAILPLESRFSPMYLDAVIKGLSYMLNYEASKTNVAVGIEAKGFLITPSIAKEFKKNCVVIRKRDYKVPDQIVIKHETAYGKKENLFCVGLKKGDKALLFDDMISGGGTMIPTIKELEKHCEVVCSATLYDRGSGREIVEKETGFSPKSLATIDIIDKKVKVVSFYPENNL